MQNSWSYWKKIWMFHQISSGISTSYCQFLKRIKVYIVSQHGMTRWFIDYFKGDMSRWLLFYVKSALKSGRSSDGGERVKSYAGKTRGFPRQFLALAVLTERLEQDNFILVIECKLFFIFGIFSSCYLCSLAFEYSPTTAEERGAEERRRYSQAIIKSFPSEI